MWKTGFKRNGKTDNLNGMAIIRILHHVQSVLSGNRPWVSSLTLARLSQQSLHYLVSTLYQHLITNRQGLCGSVGFGKQ